MNKFLNSAGLAQLWAKIKEHIADGYVAKITGKGLSTNDYTTAEKDRLAIALTTVPMATETVLGGFKAKDRTTETNEVAIDTATGKLYTVAGAGEYTLPTATSVILGGVRADAKTTETTPVVVDSNGNLFVGATSYTLPTASDTVKGGVKIGNGLEMTGEVLAIDPLEVASQDDIDTLTTALTGKADLVGGKIPSSQLPDGVSKIESSADKASFPATGEADTIYVAEDTNLTYRWSGTDYVEISPSLALGTTALTAHRGDHGVIAYNHSQIVIGNPHGTSKADIGLGNVDNTSDANKPVSTAIQTALDLKLNIADMVALTEAEITAILV